MIRTRSQRKRRGRKWSFQYSISGYGVGKVGPDSPVRAIAGSPEHEAIPVISYGFQ